jgi:phage shock protein PspC (stress-responsive transcriptional regulator)
MRKKLFRSHSDKKIFGVCGGFGEYFNIDSSLIRIIFVISTFAGSIGLWIYFISALILKYNPDYNDPCYFNDRHNRLIRPKRNAKLFGVCEAYANYFDIDVTVLRIVFLVSALFGIGLIFYIVSGIIIPAG